jgi:hypothetical protein
VDKNNRAYADKDEVLFNKAFTELVLYPERKPGPSYSVQNGVTNIGEWAFQSCSNLGSITLPASLTAIGEKVFNKCGSLRSVTLPSSLTTIGYRAFNECGSLVSIALHEGLTTIEYGAFNECGSLVSVTLPASLTAIGYGVFSLCGRLASITVQSPNPPALDHNGLWPSRYSSLRTIILVPATSVDAYKSAEGWERNADRIQAAR